MRERPAFGRFGLLACLVASEARARHQSMQLIRPARVGFPVLLVGFSMNYPEVVETWGSNHETDHHRSRVLPYWRQRFCC